MDDEEARAAKTVTNRESPRFGEPEYRRETFIPSGPGQERRNREIWEEAARSLEMDGRD